MLETLCAAVSQTTQFLIRPDAADAVVRRLEAVLTSCDELKFDHLEEAVAYMSLHLADRYGRVTQVLDILLEHGDLPIRQKGLSVLEVGSGPAPALYAISDYYQDLAQWAKNYSPEVKLSAVSKKHGMDRGAAWSRLIHALSEQLLILRGDNTVGGQPFFQTRYSDIAGFHVRELHRQALEASARSIQYEADTWDEDISLPQARRMAQDSEMEAPSAYDFIVMSNFLTTDAIPASYASEIITLSRSLTPGGLLIVLGGTDGKYPTIYQQVRKLIANRQLRELPWFPDPLQAHQARKQWHTIACQHTRDLRFMRNLAPSTFDELGEVLKRIADGPENDRFPKFSVLAWKRQGSDSRRRPRTRISETKPL
jgi:hypothetical protein